MVPGSFGFGTFDFAATTTFAPSRAAARPMAWPMPRLAPVMKSVFPASEGIGSSGQRERVSMAAAPRRGNPAEGRRDIGGGAAIRHPVPSRRVWAGAHPHPSRSDAERIVSHPRPVPPRPVDFPSRSP